MAAEHLSNDSRFFRLFKQFNRESTIIVIVCVALAAAVISWFRAERAIDEAKGATAIAETWQTMYKETERECRLAQLEIDAFKIALIRQGIDLKHEGEKP